MLGVSIRNGSERCWAFLFRGAIDVRRLVRESLGDVTRRRVIALGLGLTNMESRLPKGSLFISMFVSQNATDFCRIESVTPHVG